MLIVAFKIMIDEDRKASLVIYKAEKLSKLLEQLIHTLQYAFPEVRVISKPDHYYIAGISNSASFAAIKSYIEEIYIRFLDEEDSEEIDLDSKWLFF